MIQTKTIELQSNGDIYQQLADELNISRYEAKTLLYPIIYGHKLTNLKLKILVDNKPITKEVSK